MGKQKKTAKTASGADAAAGKDTKGDT
eukprot:SAG31_NODE_48777_length_169_cov_16.628571_1_plen_26_part_10